MNAEQEIIKMLEEHPAHYTYASDIKNSVMSKGVSEDEYFTGMRKLEYDGVIEKVYAKYRLVVK